MTYYSNFRENIHASNYNNFRKLKLARAAKQVEGSKLYKGMPWHTSRDGNELVGVEKRHLISFGFYVIFQ